MKYNECKDTNDPRSPFSKSLDWLCDNVGNMVFITVMLGLGWLLVWVILSSRTTCPKCDRSYDREANYCPNCGYMIRDMK